MKTALQLLGLALFAGTPLANAQFVKGNEAVKVLAAGTRQVETPPLPKSSLTKPCPASDTACTSDGWKMVETDRGIEECTEFYARPGTCRKSTYGAEKRPRVWVVKRGGEWLQCQFPDMQKACVALSALPLISNQ